MLLNDPLNSPIDRSDIDSHLEQMLIENEGLHCAICHENIYNCECYEKNIPPQDAFDIEGDR